MSTRAQRNRRAKKSRYLLLAALGLLSLIAYTMSHNSSSSSGLDAIAQASQLKSRSHQSQDVMPAFTQRWQQAQTDIENYLMDDDFKKTRYFFEGYNVASNEEFVLPTEETGAGHPKENYIQDLNDVVAAEMVPTGYSAGGSGASGGGAGGGVGGGAGGGRDRNPTQYVTKEDLGEDGNGGDINEGGGSNGGVSTVPVPSAIWLLGSALLGFVGLRRK